MTRLVDSLKNHGVTLQEPEDELKEKLLEIRKLFDTQDEQRKRKVTNMRFSKSSIKWAEGSLFWNSEQTHFE